MKKKYISACIVKYELYDHDHFSSQGTCTVKQHALERSEAVRACHQVSVHITCIVKMLDMV